MNKNLIKNLSLILPCGFLVYEWIDKKLSSEKKDFGNKKFYHAKGWANAAYTGLFIGYAIFVPIITGGSLSPKRFIKSIKETTQQKKLEQKNKEKLSKLKKSLESKVDRTPKGLSHSEEFEIYKLMEIQDSSKTYVPTLEDWQRGYVNYLKKMRFGKKSSN